MSERAGWSTIQSFQRDKTVAHQKLRPGTIRRIGDFARPYRRLLVAFLVVVVLDAALGTTLPLIFKIIIDDGITRHRIGLVEELSVLLAGIALADAVLSLFSRWLSARIGEGLIFDLRAQVFDHVQRQPLAFFSRTQTGALIQRLNGDVLGAQQAFTSTLSNVVSNLLSVALVLGAMFVMSWQITLLALVVLPLFVVPARLMAGKLRELTAETYKLNATMAQTMTERAQGMAALTSERSSAPCSLRRLR